MPHCLQYWSKQNSCRIAISEVWSLRAQFKEDERAICHANPVHMEWWKDEVRYLSFDGSLTKPSSHFPSPSKGIYVGRPRLTVHFCFPIFPDAKITAQMREYASSSTEHYSVHAAHLFSFQMSDAVLLFISMGCQSSSRMSNSAIISSTCEQRNEIGVNNLCVKTCQSKND
jgi:hypothetical protein